MSAGVQVVLRFESPTEVSTIVSQSLAVYLLTSHPLTDYEQFPAAIFGSKTKTLKTCPSPSSKPTTSRSKTRRDTKSTGHTRSTSLARSRTGKSFLSMCGSGNSWAATLQKRFGNGAI